MFSRQTAENAYLGDVAAGELLADNHLALEARVAAAEVARTALGRGQADVARLRAKRAVGARLARRLGTHVLERKKEIRFRLRKPKEAKRQRKETKRKRYLEIVASAGGRAEAAEIAVLALVALAHAHAVKARRIAVGRLKQHCQRTHSTQQQQQQPNALPFCTRAPSRSRSRQSRTDSRPRRRGTWAAA